MEESVVEEVPPPHDTFERDLLARLQSVLPDRKKNTQFSRAVAGINWEQVAFGDYSADECRQRWLEVQSRLRVHRTLGELLDDAQASRWDRYRARKALQVKLSAEGAPTKPLSAYLLFCQKHRPKLVKKHPGMSPAEAMSVLAKRYAALSPVKKAAYRERASAAFAEYQAAMDEFRRQHPGLGVNIEKPPRRPPTARELYVRKHASSMSRAEAFAAYKALSDEEKARYNRKWARATQRYEKEVEAFQNMHPGWKPPRPLKKQDTDKRKDGPRRLRRAYDVFLKEAFKSAEVANLPNLDRMKHCAAMWQSVDAASRLRFQELADEENEERIATLSEEEQAELRKKQSALNMPQTRRKPKKKKVKKITAKQLFLSEKMPTDFDALSEEEWRRILSRKFSKLSPQDKEMYTQRAAEATAAQVPEAAAASDGDDPAEDDPAAASGSGDEHDPMTEPDDLAGLNGYGDSDGDVKPPIMDGDGLTSGPEAGDSGDEEEESPVRHPGKAAKVSGKATGPVLVDVFPTTGQQFSDASLSPAYDDVLTGGTAATEDGLSPIIPRGKKRAKVAPVIGSSGDDSEQTAKKKKKKHQEPVLEEQNGGEKNSSAYEWFFENFRTKSTPGLTEKKLRKKARKAWNSLSDNARRVVERRSAKKPARR